MTTQSDAESAQRIEDRIKVLKRRSSALIGACPRCKADPWEKCFSVSGGARRVGPHKQRLEAADMRRQKLLDAETENA